MKKYAAFLCLLIPAAAWANTPFELTGDVAGKDGCVVALTKDFFTHPRQLARDTIREGHFHFSCAVDEVEPVTLSISKDRMTTTYTVILEEGKVRFSLSKAGSLEITGGRYNQLLFAFLRLPEYTRTENEFRTLTKGGFIDSVRGTDKEYAAIQLFMRKDEIRTDYLNHVMLTDKDPHARVLAAIQADLQPDRKKAMEVVEATIPLLGDSSALVRSAREMDRQQEDMIRRREGKMAGQRFPDFKAFTPQGDTLLLSEFIPRHKYTLLQFWASWCVPCRHEVPLLKDLYQAYEPKGLGVVSFSLDDNKTSWKKGAEACGFTWTDVSDLKAFEGPVARAYQVSSIPANVIIDRDGTIVASNLVGEDLDSEIKKLFQPYPQLPGQQSPVAGKPLTIRYMPGDTAFVQGTAYIFDSAKVIDQVSFFLQKEEGVWKTRVDIPAGAVLVHLFFTTADGKRIDDNDGRGYLLPVYHKGNPVPYAYAQMARLRTGIPMDEDRLKEDQHQALADMKEEVRFHPEDEQPLMHSYYNMLANSPEKTDHVLLFQRLSVMKSDKEEDLAMAHLYYFYLGGKKQADSLDAVLNRKYPNWKQVRQKLESPPPTPTFTAPDPVALAKKLAKEELNEASTPLTLTDLTGNKVTIGEGDLKGKTIIIDFWATWCHPCVASFKPLQQLVEKYKDSTDVRFLFICTLDSAARAAAFMREHAYPFQVLVDEKTDDGGMYKAYSHYKVEKGIPYKLVIDKNGIIRFRTVGYDGDERLLIAEMEDMIKMARAADAGRGTAFEKGLSFEQLKEKARRENKYVFVDCSTTWCTWCKKMIADVFPQASVGAFMNKNFVSVEVQMDSTAKDNDYVKSWRADAHTFAPYIHGYPTYLIFTPDGRLVHSVVGYHAPDEWIAAAKAALDPKTQYYTLLRAYQTGDRDMHDLCALAMGASAIGDQTTLDTSGALFKVLLRDPGEVDAILGKGQAEGIVAGIIMREAFYQPLRKGNPDLDELWATARTQFPTVDLSRRVAMLKVQVCQQKGDWAKFRPAVMAYMEQYGAEADPALLNDFAWTVFENCPDPACITKALEWSKRSIDETKGEEPAFLDTYANLLYKTGNRAEAIAMEEQALTIADAGSKADYKATLEKMRAAAGR